MNDSAENLEINRERHRTIVAAANKALYSKESIDLPVKDIEQFDDHESAPPEVEQIKRKFTFSHATNYFNTSQISARRLPQKEQSLLESSFLAHENKKTTVKRGNTAIQNYSGNSILDLLNEDREEEEVYKNSDYAPTPAAIWDPSNFIQEQDEVDNNQQNFQYENNTLNRNVQNYLTHNSGANNVVLLNNATKKTLVLKDQADDI